jgi:hypothetical protein
MTKGKTWCRGITSATPILSLCRGNAHIERTKMEMRTRQFGGKQKVRKRKDV